MHFTMGTDRSIADDPNSKESYFTSNGLPESHTFNSIIMLHAVCLTHLPKGGSF